MADAPDPLSPELLPLTGAPVVPAALIARELSPPTEAPIELAPLPLLPGPPEDTPPLVPAFAPVELAPLVPGADPFPRPPQARTATSTTVESASIARGIGILSKQEPGPS